MSEIKDPLFRYLALLQLIPRYPAKISTPVLHAKLEELGFRITARSLQRDLGTYLSRHFPIICHQDERPYRWSLAANALLNLPAMNAAEALAFHLAEGHLRQVLPQTVLDYLSPQFRGADQYLNNLQQNGLANWSRRVRTLPNGKALTPALVDAQCWSTVSSALMEMRTLDIEYLSRSHGQIRRYCLRPLGLVSRYTVSYLIADKEETNERRHFALHRIRAATMTNRPACMLDDFDIDAYIASGAFSFRRAAGDAELVADIHPQVAWLLRESPLCDTQMLSSLPDSEWFRLNARIPLDEETFWWLFGLNDQIRLYEPLVWVSEFAAKVKQLNDWYEPHATLPVASATDTDPCVHQQT